jgi:uncharacterized membrane protein
MLHLIHPALLHFSVAFLTVGGACEIAGILTHREALETFGVRSLLIGLASLVPTMISGYLAANTVDVTVEGRWLLDAHERNGWIVLGLLVGTQFWKAWCGGSLGTGQRKLYALLVAAAVGLLLYGAWLGGQMVYVHGVGVR